MQYENRDLKEQIKELENNYRQQIKMNEQMEQKVNEQDMK